jgi:mannose-1-phosphate guanylyltransferase/mannose-6-phosphate isomerase
MYPKQFLPLVSEQTMLQETVTRLQQFPGKSISFSPPLVICNEVHRFIVAEQLRSIAIKPTDIILEPFGKNTAPAIALAALAQPEAVLLVLPADHVIKNIAAFEKAFISATNEAKEGRLVTFGIVPTAPETGYGYIKKGEQITSDSYTVKQFVEKPDKARAEDYLASGDYLWNSGMFMFSAGSYLEELKKHSPEILSACEQAYSTAERDIDFMRINAESFEHCPEDSIDYAVMEKMQDGVVVPLAAEWSDVGSWSALWEASDQDHKGNVLKGDIVTTDTQDCYVQAEHKLITTIGLRNLVIVETDDAIMVADKSKVQEVKAIVNQLKKENRSECNSHRKVYRPWGYYDAIDNGERFQVKRIVVNPGEQLSLQMHHHRAEHWVVVQGTAKVRCGDTTLLLSENQSTYIPLGETHQLINPGKVPLEIIEVQSGAYLGEDDIVRLEDVYGRK